MERFYRLELELVTDADALPGVVATCHQRGCRIVSLRYDQSRCECMIVVIKATNRRAEILALKLANLILVLAVRMNSTGQRLAASEAPSADHKIMSLSASSRLCGGE